MRYLLSFLLVGTIPLGVFAQDMPLSQILLPGETWQPVAKVRSVGSLACDREGTVYVSDPEGKQILRLLADGSTQVVQSGVSVHGLAFGPRGHLYGCAPTQKQILIGLEGKDHKQWAGGLAAQDLVVTRSGICYCTVPMEQAIYRVNTKGQFQRVAQNLKTPAGLMLWSGEGTLVVGEATGRHLVTFRIGNDGQLVDRERYYTLRVRSRRGSEVRALTVDRVGRGFAATRQGVQVFDTTGRMSGVLSKPQRRPVTAMAFGGKDRDYLYIVCGNQLYSRKLKTRGEKNSMRIQQSK